MKKTRFLALALSLAVALTPTAAYAASGGRISSGGFRSSRSSFSSGSSRSYRPSPSSFGGSSGYSRRSSPSIPRSTRSQSSYDDFLPEVYVPPIPQIPRTRVVVIPAPAPAPVVVSPGVPIANPAQVVTATSGTFLPQFLLAFLLVVGAGALLLWWLSTHEQNGLPTLVNPVGEKYNLYRLRVALLASAKELQSNLLSLAEKGDTDTNEGLSEILKDTVLALMRHPDEVVYADSYSFSGNPEAVENKFNVLALEERSKISEEVVSSVSGKLTEDKLGIGTGFNKDNEFILVSILMASDQDVGKVEVENMGDLRSSLVSMGSVDPDNLCALEIIWQPEGENEVLTKSELLSLYPTLKIM